MRYTVDMPEAVFRNEKVRRKRTESQRGRTDMKKILVVDDEKEIADLIEVYLVADGW